MPLCCVCVLQLTGSQADLVAAASSGNLQALNSMSTGNLTGLGSNGSLSQSQVWPRLLPRTSPQCRHVCLLSPDVSEVMFPV